MKHFVFLLCILWATVADANSAVVALTQLHNHYKDRGPSLGTGTIIHQAGEVVTVLTCGHGWDKDEYVLIDNRDENVVYRGWFKAIETTGNIDLGLIQFTCREELDVIPVSKIVPKVGQDGFRIGYVKTYIGRVQGGTDCKIIEHNRGLTKTSADLVAGQSGGPLTVNDALVGVMCGSYQMPEAGAKSFAVDLPTIRRFLNELILEGYDLE